MLCKCSGKYSDIYFILKITYYCVYGSGLRTFIRVDVYSSGVDISLDNCGFNVTDAGVHHSGPPKSSGSSTSSWDSALCACILDE